MNWKLIATLCVGASLLTACGASNKAAEPVNSSPGAPSQHRGIEPMPEEESGTGAATPDAKEGAAPGTSPAGVVVHEKKDR